jgi:hypothetical protein
MAAIPAAQNWVIERKRRMVSVGFFPSQFHTYLRRSFHAIDAKTAP